MIRVSVIIPCYNREQLLPATLESVRSQTYSEWECIIVDDCSNDGSKVMAQRFAQQDRRFRVVGRQGRRRGANVCRNQGLKLAQGEFVIFLDSDDLLASTCLEHRVDLMEAAPGYGFGVFLAELFREKVGDLRVFWNIYTKTNDLTRFLSKDTVWDTTGPIWRRQVVESLGGFDEDLLSFQDWDLHVRALCAGIPYFRNETRDHFYRNGYPGSSAISTVSVIHSDHLQSHERLFVKTAVRLREAGLLDGDHRDRVAGLFWWLAKCRLNHGGVRESMAIWRRARELGLCQHHQSYEGLVMLSLYSLRGCSRLANLIQQLWPVALRRVGSEYLHQAPVDETRFYTREETRLAKLRPLTSP